MEYECQTIPVDKAVVTAQGFMEPLCSSCSSPDCSNPIKEKTVSVAGVVKKLRFYVTSEASIRQVTSCKGYIGDVITPMGNN